MAKSRFAGISLEELLEVYFGGRLIAKKEEREEEKRRKDAFLMEVQKGYENTLSGKWLQTTLKEHTAGYEILIRAIQ